MAESKAMVRAIRALAALRQEGFDEGDEAGYERAREELAEGPPILTDDDRVDSPKLGLDVRTSNMLILEGITTIGQLVRRDEGDLLDIRNFGPGSVKKVTTRLARFDRKLHGSA
jgi:DNA-directed RNA polymerase alpha subunit